MSSKPLTLIVLTLVCLQLTLPATMQASAYHFPEASGDGVYITINQSAAQCTVTKTADSGSGTLRQCLLNATAGVVIDFDPNKFQPTKPVSITVASSLPAITVNDVTIDGSNAGVILDGSQLQRGDGLVIQGAQGVTIRGLTIRRFPQAGLVILGGAKNNVIGGNRAIGAAPLGQGNLISNNGEGGMIIQDMGTTGNTVLGNQILRNVGAGVRIRRLASQNTIGTGNVISGNGGAGVWISDANPADPLQSTSENKVTGNHIGVDATGTISVTFGNGGTGVFISDGARKNIIGGQLVADRNVISGNASAGVAISDANSDQNQILGNLVGTDVTGTKALRNDVGVRIQNGAQQNIIGGTTDGARNIISGNATGMTIWDSGTTQNKVIGNFIGTDVSGTKAVPNGNDGIRIGNGAHNNIIGGVASEERNVVSGNGDEGFVIQDEGTDGNRIIGNFIGTDVTGKNALGNNTSGVLIIDGPDKTEIGGILQGEGNVISGNLAYGVFIRDPGSVGNKIQGNIIGLDVAGLNRLSNGDNGVSIFEGANNNTIGGETQGARNIISGNGFHGVSISHSGTNNNKVQGNFIGVDVTGQKAQGNKIIGIFIGLGAKNNLIGGEGQGAGNVISGNGDSTINSNGSGVWLTGANANKILGNYIGTGVDGLKALGNKHDGITIVDQASDNIIGGINAGNIIGGNGDSGVWIEGAATRGNIVSGNHIGTAVNGAGQLPNTNYGVYLGNGAISNTIGVSNTIVYNIKAGVALSGTATLGNKITRNSIHSNQGGQIVWLTPNGLLQPPKLTDYSTTNHTLSGEGCAGCRIEIYANPEDKAAGTLYLNATTANQSGAFMSEIKPPAGFGYVSALQIMSDGTTSEFSNSIKVVIEFNLYLPLIRNSINGAESLQAEVDATNNADLSVTQESNAKVVSKSGRQDLLSGGEKQHAHTDQ